MAGAKYGKANEQSRRRAYRNVFDYAACNDDVFDLFVTITLDKECIDRYDIKQIYPKFKAFLSNHVQRNGLAYVIVPEYHKDGAIHFHGLINSSAVKLKDSGKRYWKRNTPCYGQRIYNVTDWKFGFTTAVKLKGDYTNVCKYITKYVMKQAEGGMIGGRYYYHGGKLKRPHYEYIHFLEEPEGKVINIPDASLTAVYVQDLAKCRYEAADVRLSRLEGGDLREQIQPGLDGLEVLSPIIDKGGWSSAQLVQPPDNRLGEVFSQQGGVVDEDGLCPERATDQAP